MYKKVSILLCIFAAGLVAIIGCSKSSEDTLGNGNGNPPPSTCDTANMSYSIHVQPILQANCYSCHGNGNTFGGINLSDYSGVKSYADDGRLIGAITHAAGYSPMPQGGAKMSACNINKIQSWVDRGAPNN